MYYLVKGKEKELLDWGFTETETTYEYVQNYITKNDKVCERYLSIDKGTGLLTFYTNWELVELILKTLYDKGIIYIHTYDGNGDLIPDFNGGEK